VRRLAAALLLLATGCVHETAEGLPPGTSVEDLPESESWGATLRVTAAGAPRLTLSAPYLARYQRPDTAYVFLGPAPGADADSAARVRVEMFSDAGAPTASVTADRAWFHERDGRLVAEGRVAADLTGGGGARVEAARLVTTSGGPFTASGGVTVDLRGQAQARVRARSVSGTAGGGRYEAEGAVQVDAAGGRRLEAGRVVWDEAAGRFSAPGAFRFDGPAERVRGVGLSASADLSRYSFRSASGEIEVRE
jgi:hypothetical protein